jgi:fermentation-respiration switch protein FrsA (DUF1100 family)
MISILLKAGTAWILIMVVMYLGQRRMMYLPDHSVPHPHDHDLPRMESVRIAVADDIEILAWWHAPTDDAHPVLVYFHGNAGHIGARDYKIRELVEAGYGVLLTTYRYNAGAGGKGSEEALLADARDAIDYVVGHDIAEDRIVLYGESLGTGVAVAMAAERNVAGLVLETPFSSIAEVANSRYWFVLAKWLVRDRYDSMARIGKVRAPILLFHGDADKTIPIRFGERLYDAAPEPKEGHFFSGGNHTDLYDHGAGELVMDFVDRCAARIRANLPVKKVGGP